MHKDVMKMAALNAALITARMRSKPSIAEMMPIANVAELLARIENEEGFDWYAQRNAWEPTCVELASRLEAAPAFDNMLRDISQIREMIRSELLGRNGIDAARWEELKQSIRELQTTQVDGDHMTEGLKLLESMGFDKTDPISFEPNSGLRGFVLVNSTTSACVELVTGSWMGRFTEFTVKRK